MGAVRFFYSVLIVAGVIGALLPLSHIHAQSEPGSVQTVFITNPIDQKRNVEKKRQIELFIVRPSGRQLPALIYIHGFMSPPGPGGYVYVQFPTLQNMAARGVVAVAISQPGFGRSDGPSDFSGSKDQAALEATIEYVRSLPYVDPNRVALYGISRGAVVASNVATRDSKLAALVVSAGTYDMKDTYQWAGTTIKRALEYGAGFPVPAEDFAARSALKDADKIRAPTLILQGEKDEIFPAYQAKWFKDRIEQAGIPVKVVIFSGVPHVIPLDVMSREVDPFIDRYLLKR